MHIDLRAIGYAGIVALAALVFDCAVLTAGEKATKGTRKAPATTRNFSLLKKDEWVVKNTRFTASEYKGKKALRLKGNYALAYIKGLEFEDGTIEVDVASLSRGRMYFGVAFRVQEDVNKKVSAKDNSKQKYEYVYFRPFASETPNAVQYCAAGTKYNWEYLRKNFPGVYEAKAKLPAIDWFHVKIVVSGQKAEVYVNNAKKPALTVKDLKHGKSKGSVGVYTYWKTACFANLKVTVSKPAAAGTKKKADEDKKKPAADTKSDKATITL